MKKIKGFFILSTMFISFSVVSCGGGNNNPTPTPVTLTALSVSASDKDYLVGDYLYQDELKVYAIYSNNTYKTVTDFTCPELSEGYYTFESAKTYTFNISYGGKTEQLKIKAKNSPSDKDDYTLLIYMCASTLESDIVKAQERSGYTTTAGYASLDLQEILSTCAATPNNVNVVIRTGGTSKWGNLFDGIIDRDHIQTFHVHNHDLVEDTSARIEYDTTTKKVTMSDKDRLKDFINYGKTNYPADKTALILWDHGGGMAGVCQDTRYTLDTYPSLMASDVSYALEQTGCGTDKLDWIGYDACLMGVQDVLLTNSNYAKYMIASEENEPAKGWKYDYWLNNFYKQDFTASTYTPQNTLVDIANSFVWDNGPISTMASFDLTNNNHVAEYKTAWNDLVKAINTKVLGSNKQTNWDKMTDYIYKEALKFGKETLSVSETGYYYEDKDFYSFGVYDLLSVMKVLNSHYKNQLETYITTLTEKYNSLLMGNNFGEYYDKDNHPCGLTMFCPIEKNTLYYVEYESGRYCFAADRDWYKEGETPLTSWQDLCNTYGQWCPTN